MSVDTKARLDGHVKPSAIIKWLEENVDADVKSHFSSKYTFEEIDDKEWNDYGESPVKDAKYQYDDSGHWKTQGTFINFKYKGKTRSIYYFYSNINSLENLEHYKKHGLEQMVKAETTTLMMGAGEEAVDILKKMCMHFGGWIDENDCDDKEFYRISKINVVKTFAETLRRNLKK